MRIFLIMLVLVLSLTFGVAISLLAGCCNSMQDLDPIDLDLNYNAIVRVENRAYEIGHYGTGFFISKNYVITAKHVLKGMQLGDSVWISQGNSYECRVVFLDEKYDIAVIYSPNFEQEPLRLCAEYCGVTHAYAFKMRSENDLRFWDSYADMRNRHIYGIFQSFVEAGTSGGPVISSELECVIGMIISGNSKISDFIISGVLTERAIRFLDE